MAGRETRTIGIKTPKKEKRKYLTAAVVTMLVLACCGAAYILADSDYGEAALTQTLAPVLRPSREAFLQSALAGRIWVQRTQEGCALMREGEREDAVLRVSLRNRGVCGYMLSVPITQVPAQKHGKTPLEKNLYAYERARYEEDLAWVSALFPALTRALDTAGALTETDIDYLLGYLRETMETGKRAEKRAGPYKMVAYVDTACAPTLQVQLSYTADDTEN